VLLHVRKESLVNSRPHNQNLIVISEAEHCELEKSRRNAEYLAKLEHSMQQFKEGKGVVKTMDELLNMEK
jgi:toxin-antitoxin system, antitoxin component, PHD family